MEKWLDQRELHDRYDDSDALWLTRFENPYSSQSLKRLLHRLCDIADIDTEGRKMSWYAIRHSVGTYMTREEDLEDELGPSPWEMYADEEEPWTDLERLLKLDEQFDYQYEIAHVLGCSDSKISY